MRLTVGMATYDDFQGVFYTVQSLRMHHDLTDCEVLVVDNFGCEHTSAFCRNWNCARYIRCTEIQGTAAPRQRVFEEALGDAVLCIDSHVLLVTDVIQDLKRWFMLNPGTKDMLQGPMLYDDLQTAAIAMDPVWRDEMFGVWRNGPAPTLDTEPFEIPMHGLGLFAMRKDAWPGFNPAFRGFGGEEGYIHEKVRRAGGKCLCLPWLRWHHYFRRSGGVPYHITVAGKFRNYLIGCKELGTDARSAVDHFASRLPRNVLQSIIQEIYQ